MDIQEQTKRPVNPAHSLALETAAIFGFRWNVDTDERVRELIRHGNDWNAVRHDRFLARYCELFEHALNSQSGELPSPAISYATLAGNGAIDCRMAVNGFNIDRQSRGEVVQELYSHWEKWVAVRLRRYHHLPSSVRSRERFCKTACAMFLAIEPFETFNSRIMMLVYFTLRHRLGLSLEAVPVEGSKPFFKELSEIRRKYIVPYLRGQHLLT